MSSYFKVFSTIAKKLKGNKSKVSPTIKSVKPASGSLTKRRKDTEDQDQEDNNEDKAPLDKRVEQQKGSPRIA